MIQVGRIFLRGFSYSLVAYLYCCLPSDLRSDSVEWISGKLLYLFYNSHSHAILLVYFQQLVLKSIELETSIK